MPVEEQLNIIFQILQAGRNIPVEEVIDIVPDVGTGLVPYQGTTELVTLGNGTATEITSVVVDSTAVEIETAGVGLLAMDVGAVGIAIAPALGILAGVGLYSLAPEFWTNVSNALVNAGQTIGGKVRCFVNGETREIGVSEETLEIFKQAFIDVGLFESETIVPTYPDVGETYTVTGGGGFYQCLKMAKQQGQSTSLITRDLANLETYVLTNYPDLILNHWWVIALTPSTQWGYGLYEAQCFLEPVTGTIENGNLLSASENISGGYRSFWSSGGTIGTSLNRIYRGMKCILSNPTSFWSSTFGYGNANVQIIPNPDLQEGAIYPNENPIPEIYPEWNPWTIPVEGFPEVYPIECPAIQPEPDQQQAQNPDPLPNDDPALLPWITGVLPQPSPNPNPYPEPSPNPDPDPQPEPDPIPEPQPQPSDPNPPDPNPDPTDPYLPVVPEVPDTVPANAMFTVYKPTLAQVNAFGGWLWSNNIMEMIKRIWQNPLDGIISFMKVYATPTTGVSDTIKVGNLDSEVSSAVVTSQFVTVECGSLNIREKFYNATDWSPFVALHLYLPFIGIVELDVDEFMSGEIKVTYHVDVYTGTCLAEVKSKRSPDMMDWTIVYTFSGNASQQLPLTSAEFSGALSSLVGVVGGGLAIASGGGLGLLAGATGIAHAVTHEMVHLAHSGSLSANAGIMGARKPYLILTRRRSYDANGYNQLYGYPSNKTVFLNNCSGFVKVKEIQLQTGATGDENAEIVSLLKGGVII